MKPLRTLFSSVPLLGALSTVLIAAEPAKVPAKTVTPPPLSPRFQQVRDKIGVLFDRRDGSPMAVDPKLNPFRPPGAVIAVIEPSSGPAPARDPSTDLALLQQNVATLKVSGIFEIGGKQHLVINSRPYKEGDVIQTQVQGQPIYLRVRSIARSSITLALNEAEMTLKF